METIELTGVALDYAVAMAEGIPSEDIKLPGWKGDNLYRFRRDEDGKKDGFYTTGSGLVFHKGPAGDDIIDREGISTQKITDEWEASIYNPTTQCMHGTTLGPTRRIAAMRCYVASKLGWEVELPVILK